MGGDGVRISLRGAIFLGYSPPGGDNPRNIAPLLRGGGGGRISWGAGESPVTPVLSNNLGNAMCSHLLRETLVALI